MSLTLSVTGGGGVGADTFDADRSVQRIRASASGCRMCVVLQRPIEGPFGVRGRVWSRLAIGGPVALSEHEQRR